MKRFTLNYQGMSDEVDAPTTWAVDDADFPNKERVDVVLAPEHDRIVADMCKLRDSQVCEMNETIATQKRLILKLRAKWEHRMRMASYTSHHIDTEWAEIEAIERGEK